MKNETNGKMITHIQNKIKSLKDELISIEYSSSPSTDNLSMTKFDKKRILELRSKIQVLNEVIISFGIQNK